MKKDSEFFLYKMPLIVLLVALVYWVIGRQLDPGATSFAMHHYPKQEVFGQLLMVTGVSTLRILVLGLVLDFIGGRRALIFFLLSCFLFSAFWSFQSSVTLFGLGAQFYGVAEMLMLIGAYKYIAVYSSRKTFLFNIAAFFCLNAILGYYLPHLITIGNSWEAVDIGGLILGAVALALAALAVFFLPSQKTENTLYSFENYSDILKPLARWNTWGIMVSIGVVLMLLSGGFDLLVASYFGPVLHISKMASAEMIDVFTIAVAVGYLVYAILFKGSDQKNRVVAVSNILIILCMLGIGFFSMSNLLVWALVVLMGLFFGSSVLFFDGLLTQSKVAGYASVLAVAIVISQLLKAIFVRGLLVPVVQNHAGGVHSLETLWMLSILLMIIPLVFGYFCIKSPEEKKTKILPHPDLKGRLGNYWRGDYPLKQTFWMLFILGQSLVLLVLSTLVLILLTPIAIPYVVEQGHISMGGVDYYVIASLITVLAVINLCLTVFSFVSVWRSAKRSQSRFWKSLGRTVMCLSMLGAVAYVLLCALSFVHIQQL